MVRVKSYNKKMLQLLLLLPLRGAGDTGQVPACRPRHPSFANTRPVGRRGIPPPPPPRRRPI